MVLFKTTMGKRPMELNKKLIFVTSRDFLDGNLMEILILYFEGHSIIINGTTVGGLLLQVYKILLVCTFNTKMSLALCLDI